MEWCYYNQQLSLPLGQMSLEAPSQLCLSVVLTAVYNESQSSSLQERKKKCVVFVHLIVLQLGKLHGVPRMTKTDGAVNT